MVKCIITAIMVVSIGVGNAAIAAPYIVPKPHEVRVDPTPGDQLGPTYGGANRYKLRIKNRDKFRPGYVFFKEKNCWLNVSVFPAVERNNRLLYLYYPNMKQFYKVVFRNSAEAIMALNILLEGHDCELPPYYIEEVMP